MAKSRARQKQKNRKSSQLNEALRLKQEEWHRRNHNHFKEHLGLQSCIMTKESHSKENRVEGALQSISYSTKPLRIYQSEPKVIKALYLARNTMKFTLYMDWSGGRIRQIEYTQIVGTTNLDREIIHLLYLPEIEVGRDERWVRSKLIEIYIKESQY